jgi:hypothetical protein
MTTHKWQFASRFRRNAFGWRSDAPIKRIKEAVTEIRQAAKKDAVLGALGAVTLLEKLSPALEHVDSSSGSLGAAVNGAIDTLVQIIASPDVNRSVRQRWLERLWEAVEDDGMPYIEVLGEYWGEVCVTKELASEWADRFLPSLERVWSMTGPQHIYYKGTTACLASLCAAGRHEQLLALLQKSRYNSWSDRRWGVRALVAMGKKAEAIRYAEETRGLNSPDWQISQDCEAILLSSGLPDEAYSRYALEANVGTTNLATFRAIAKKYPHKPAQDILRRLVQSQPGAEGKWFAAAKDAGLFDLAIELVTHSPTDPRTLARAARDYCIDQPRFAVASGMAALHWISQGHGYDITGTDVLDAYTALMQAARGAGMDENGIAEQIRTITSGSLAGSRFLKSILDRHLSS